MQALKQQSFTPLAEEVAQDIMDNINTEHDFMDWASLSEQSIVEAFNEVIGTIATFKADKALNRLENRSERLSQIEDCIEGYLKAWALKEGFSQ